MRLCAQTSIGRCVCPVQGSSLGELIADKQTGLRARSFAPQAKYNYMSGKTGPGALSGWWAGKVRWRKIDDRDRCWTVGEYRGTSSLPRPVPFWQLRSISSCVVASSRAEPQPQMSTCSPSPELTFLSDYSPTSRRANWRKHSTPFTLTDHKKSSHPTT